MKVLQSFNIPLEMLKLLLNIVMYVMNGIFLSIKTNSHIVRAVAALKQFGGGRGRQVSRKYLKC